MSLTTDIKGFAKEIGFELVGTTAVSPLDDTEAIMHARIRNGLMGDMGWFTHERVHKACSPRLLLPSALSIITLGAPYFSERVGENDPYGMPRGRISRYAWSKDYHDTLRELFQRIERFLMATRGANIATKAFVDSGPLAERAFAAKSGIGWFGKSSNILTREFGSWFFLGEIVTSLDLEEDSSINKSCGKCDLCLKSCPTEAIIAPYTVNAGRCISYLTIEHKGPIPRDLRPLIGNWVFGCDVCQEVCPVNRKIRVPKRSLFPPLDVVDPQPNLLEILEMSDEEYRVKFTGSPIQRAKKRGLQRNAAVALGNCGDRAVVPRLIEALDNPEGLVRGHVVWALAELGGRQARMALEAHRSRETSEFVLKELDPTMTALAKC